MPNLSKNVKVTRVMNSVAAGTSAQNSSVLDMQNFDGVMFLLLLGDVVSGSVITATANGNTASSTSSPTPVAITGAVCGPITAGASDNDNGVYLIDVFRPTKRYIYLGVTRTTQNCPIDGVIAIQYHASHKPTTQDVTTILQTAFAVGA